MQFIKVNYLGNLEIMQVYPSIHINVLHDFCIEVPL